MMTTSNPPQVSMSERGVSNRYYKLYYYSRVARVLYLVLVV